MSDNQKILLVILMLPFRQTSSAVNALEQAVQITQPLARWLIRSGIGYTEFTNALKVVFFQQAYEESQRIGQKSTISSLSLLAGLHRKDVNVLYELRNEPRINSINKPISISAQVAGHWIANKLPKGIPFQEGEVNFSALVRSISNDMHPRSICNELQRLGAVRVIGDMVYLLEQAFIPDPISNEAQHIFTQNVVDHLSAGVYNLTEASPDAHFLEQSVFADSLSTQSVEKLKNLSAQTWRAVMQQVLQEAIDLDKQDTDIDGAATERFRVGVYVYTEANKPSVVDEHSEDQV